MKITIYDVLGNEVYAYSEDKPAGHHKFEFDGSRFNSGIYFYKLEVEEFAETKKMILMK